MTLTKQAEPTWWEAFTTYFCYTQLIMWGYIRDFFAYFFRPGSKPKPGYAPLLVDFEDFYTRRLYRRIRDCWNRPIASCPGAWMDLMVRESKDNNKSLE